ncbi:FAD-dependent oxidoreductase [Altererythrobacter sp. RZ02]|uniref:FAD-dependent oxidoreductase n=1 Tax=Pontixanthobacter rizhaonensis TaxID=2730337 RepID=A0A848QPS0_9SPHN|nr:FAD-dependent oxidoreductase [Pontixanthobacter rizhaonensis]
MTTKSTRTASKSKAAARKARSGSAKTNPTAAESVAASASINTASGKSVAVVGGGIAGLTAAIKLLKAGFDVTVFEQKDRLGGNTSSTLVDGVEHDVYPHMFCDWYDNFWDLFENDLGLDRSAHFEPRAGVKMLAEGATEYQTLLNPTSLDAIFKNLKSGSLPPAEMFLTGYSMVDLAGHPFDREGNAQLERQSVNGFLYSSSTTTEEVAELENYMLEVIWSASSERTSAATYQDFIRHTLSFPDGAPFAHMLKNSLNDGLIAPIVNLITSLGGAIKTSTEVTAVRLLNDKPKVSWRAAGSNSRGSTGTFDQVIIAVPGAPLTDLVMGGASNLAGDRLIDREPSLSQVRRLTSVPIPVIDLYLKRKLPGFPPENIGLTKAKYGLSVVDIAQLWPAAQFGGKTALVIAASDGESLPGHDFADQSWYMLQELIKFYPDIDIGREWGDPNCDVDWAKTHARSNADYALFLNEVGGWDWRPEAAYPVTLPNIAFAGDLCRSNVDMATVEGAVESGVIAAEAVQRFDAAANNGKVRGQPIKLVKHLTYGNSALRAAKIALMPFAYAAKAWTLVGPRSPDAQPGLQNLGNVLQAEHLGLLPLQYINDWWTTAYWFWQSTLTGNQGGATTGPANHDDDDFIDLGAALLMVAGEFASYASEQCSGQPRPSSASRQGEPLGAGANMVRQAGKIASGFFQDRALSDDDDISPRKRRWRVKR